MSDVFAQSFSAPAGGGPYRQRDLAVGVFLSDQPAHRFSLGSDRAQHRPLGRHQGWIVPAGAEGLCLYDAPLEFVAVSLPAALLAEAGLDRPGDVAPATGELDPLLVQLALAMPTAAERGRLYAETMQRALAAQVVAAAGAPPPAAAAPVDDRRLRRAMRHVADRLGEEITLEGLAAGAAMSPFHFSRAFKAATGLSPLQYVIRERMDVAAVLLRTTRLPVAEVAHRVGYEDASRFGRHFARRHGATPGSYRAG